MSLSHILSVGLGGALGAIARFSLAYFIAQRSAVLFPWGTLAANLIGSFLIGVLYEGSTWLTIAPAVRAMIGVGFLGALTTFSTFTLETLNLVHDGEWLFGVLNLAANLVLGFGACLGAVYLTRMVGRMVLS